MDTTDVRAFFFDRLSEAFHKDTIDSHRVRCHNALTLIQESIEVVSDWSNNNVKIFETVQLCIEETKNAIEADSCIVYTICSKTILINTLLDYSKRGKDDPSFSKKLLYLLDQINSENRSVYLRNLFSKISEILLKEDWGGEENEMDVLSKLDILITAFATQLIHEGFSKIYLYKLFQKVKHDSTHQLNAKVRYIEKLLCSNITAETTTIIKLPISGHSKKILPILNLFDELPEGIASANIYDNNVSFLAPTKATRFYIHSSSCAKDSVSALKETREELSRILDVVNMGDSSINIIIPNTALVITKNPSGLDYCEMAVEYILDGSFNNSEAEIRNIIEDVNKIRISKNVSDDVKERIDSAIRHLRIGNLQTELEQRFINYWIALEFIFASPEAKESTFTRLKLNLMNILTSCYLKRNIVDLNRRLIKDGMILKGEQIWNYSEEQFNRILSTEMNSLLRYRIRKTKALVLEKHKRKALFNIHDSNLNYHLARLYRMRNELIHEAAIKQDIESVTSNLRYYLVFLLKQVILFFSVIPHDIDIPKKTFDEFFCYYDLLKSRIKEDFDLQVIMKVPCDKAIN